MGGQTSQTNTGSDSPYFLLSPFTNSFMATVQCYPCIFHTWRNSEKILRGRVTSCLEYLHCITTCFHNYTCYLFNLSSQLDKLKISKCLGWIPFSWGFSRSVLNKLKTIPGFYRSGIKINYIPRRLPLASWVNHETIYLWLWSFYVGGNRYTPQPWH